MEWGGFDGVTWQGEGEGTGVGEGVGREREVGVEWTVSAGNRNDEGKGLTVCDSGWWLVPGIEIDATGTIQVESGQG